MKPVIPCSINQQEAPSDIRNERHRLANIDWNCLSTGSVDDALNFLNNILERLMEAHVPHFMKTESRSNLPWVNNECRLAISAKHAAQDTDSYAEASACCTAVLRRVRATYFYQLKVSMERLSRCSKKWWSLNKQLLNRQAAPSLFPL